ncbi:phage tail protein [bacterium]|nr:phage tail protein [bacterium]
MIVAEFDSGQIDDFLASFSGKALDQARMRAANKAAAMGKTEGSKRIRAVWNLKMATLSPRLTVIKTKSGMTPAKIRAQSYPLSFSHFGAFEEFALGSNYELHGRGATYKLLKGGGEKNMPDAFMQPTSSGHIGFFERMDKAVPRRRWSKKRINTWGVRPRLRIRDHKAITVASMFKQPKVLPHVEAKIAEVLPKEFYRLLSR